MNNPEEKHLIDKKASAIHTKVYLKEQFIDPDDLNEEGLFLDESSARADQIVVSINGKETAIRLIHTDKKEGGLLSLPTLKYFDIDPELLKNFAGVSRLSEIREKNVVELSGLASINSSEVQTRADMLRTLDATRQVYSQSLRTALQQGHDLWVMNVDDKMITFLDTVLGQDTYKEIGEKQAYMGPPTTPIAMKPFDVVESALSAEDDSTRFATRNKKDLRYALQGVGEKFLPSKLKKMLHDNDIETTPLNPLQGALNEVWRNKKAAFYATIIGYSALRFVPVGAVEEFNGSVPLFATIDVGTAITQAGSMELFFKGRTRLIRTLGIIGTGASFAAPYAYFWANGDDYPAYVNVIAGGFVALGVGLETNRSIKDTQLKKGLINTDLTGGVSAEIN